MQQIATKDLWYCEVSTTFCFNDQCQTVSGQQLIFLKFKTKIKSKSVRKWVCKSVGFGFVKKWWNPSDSKSDSKSVTSLLTYNVIIYWNTTSCNLSLALTNQSKNLLDSLQTSTSYLGLTGIINKNTLYHTTNRPDFV